MSAYLWHLLGAVDHGLLWELLRRGRLVGEPVYCLLDRGCWQPGADGLLTVSGSIGAGTGVR